MDAEQILRWEQTFEEMLTLGNQLYRSGEAAEFVVILRTAQGNLYHSVHTVQNHIRPMLHLIDTLVAKNDTQVTHIVNFYGPDNVCGGMHWVLYTCLPQIHPNNLEAQVLLLTNTPNHYTSKPLRQMLPPKSNL